MFTSSLLNTIRAKKGNDSIKCCDFKFQKITKEGDKTGAPFDWCSCVENEHDPDFYGHFEIIFN